MIGDSETPRRRSTYAVAYTHRGRRARNEDAVRRVDLPDGRVLAIVCDGMGGHAGGAYASATALDGVMRRLSDGADPMEAIREANAALYAEAALDAARTGMGTTLVMAIVEQGLATVYNVGDSRAYLCESVGTCRPVTRDHSFVAESVASGRMSEAEALASRYKNALTRAVGTDPEVEVDRFGPFDLTDGSVLVLCSDGFYKAVPDDRVESLFRGSPASSADDVMRSVLAAFDAGSDDNISVVVVGDGSVRAKAVASRLRSLTKQLDRRLAREARAARRRQSHGGWRLAGRAVVAVGLMLGGVGAILAGLSTPDASPPSQTSPRTDVKPVAPVKEPIPTRSIDEIGEGDRASDTVPTSVPTSVPTTPGRREGKGRDDSTARPGGGKAASNPPDCRIPAKNRELCEP